MAFSNKHTFRQKIKGKRLEDFYKNLDYKITESGERIKLVNKLLDSTDGNFFEEYFDNYYENKLTQDDALASDNNVCRTLETMADYILASADVRAENKKSNKEYEYRFYKDATEFRNRTIKEVHLDGLTGHTNNKINNSKENENNVLIIDYLIKANSNSKKPKNQIINPGDIDGSYCGQILKEYQDSINYIDLELNKIKTGDLHAQKGNRYLLTKAKKDISYDMIYIKNTLKGVFGDKLRNQIMDSTVPDWDKFNWQSEKHIKELLFIRREFDMDSDLTFLVMDLDIIIKRLISANKFSERELRVLDFIEEEYKMVEMAEIMGCSKMNISLIVKNIVKKICKYTKDMKNV